MVHGMWNVPGLVIRLSAALAGGFSTTDHQGSREVVIHCNQLIIVGNTYYHRKRWSETGVGNFFFPHKGPESEYLALHAKFRSLLQPFHSVIPAPKHSQTICEGMGVAVFKKKKMLFTETENRMDLACQR